MFKRVRLVLPIIWEVSAADASSLQVAEQEMQQALQIVMFSGQRCSCFGLSSCALLLGSMWRVACRIINVMLQTGTIETAVAILTFTDSQLQNWDVRGHAECGKRQTHDGLSYCQRV